MQRFVGAAMDASPGEANNSVVGPVLGAAARAREQAFPQPSHLSADHLWLDAMGRRTDKALLHQLDALLGCHPNP